MPSRSPPNPPPCPGARRRPGVDRHDAIAAGGEHLRELGYQRSWGIGRHVQGSQIFDYWRDPFGQKHEHWTDGDLVNDATPAGVAPITKDELSQWAPPVTEAFFR